MSKIKVTFHRTYEIEKSLILQRIDDEGDEVIDDEIIETGIEIASDYLSDEIGDFTGNILDWFSYTTELIPDKHKRINK